MCVHKDDAIMLEVACVMHSPSACALHNRDHYCIKSTTIKHAKPAKCVINVDLDF